MKYIFIKSEENAGPSSQMIAFGVPYSHMILKIWLLYQLFGLLVGLLLSNLCIHTHTLEYNYIMSIDTPAINLVSSGILG